MAPVFLTLTLGSIEVGYALNASNTLYGALREGGRLASQDWSTMLAPGETATLARTRQLVLNDYGYTLNVSGKTAMSAPFSYSN